jgi:hypothetical protein
MTYIPTTTDDLHPVLQRDGACLREGVARRAWMPAELGKDEATNHHNQPSQSQPSELG